MWFLVALFALLGGAAGYLTPTMAHRVNDLKITTRQSVLVGGGAVSGALTGYAVGITWAIPAYAVMLVAGIALFFIDLEHRRLPDRFTFTAAGAVALLLAVAAAISGDWSSLWRALIAAIALTVFYFVLLVIYPAGMGMGDVKLALSLGLALGWAGWAQLVVGGFSAFMIGAIVGIGLLVTRKVGRKSHIPFGPFMLVGALLALLVAKPFIDWYLALAGIQT